eukprot:3677578-Ditylum_brightwellii.AAC.1
MMTYSDISKVRHTYDMLVTVVQMMNQDTLDGVYYNITDVPGTQNYYRDGITVNNQIKEIKAANISPTTHNLADYDVQLIINVLLQELPGEI